MSVQQPTRTYVLSPYLARIVFAIACVVALAAAFGWVSTTSVSIGWLALALVALGLAL